MTTIGNFSTNLRGRRFTGRFITMSLPRLQYELSEARFSQLKAVMETCGIQTQKELFNNALSLFEWAVKQRQQGRTIASVDEVHGKFKELSMPVLEQVRELITR